MAQLAIGTPQILEGSEAKAPSPYTAGAPLPLVGP
jgi:hypothetical protein